MTIYLTFEALKNKKIHLKQELVATDRDEDISNVNKVLTLGLKRGDKIIVEEAIKGVLVKSFNEAAVILAEAVAGSEWKFIELMNKKAKKFGMKYTNFRNSTGLPDSGQFTTNYDLARMVMAIRHDFPEYYHFFADKEVTINNVKYKTHNNILLEYKGAEGMKTGFTNAAGYNLIAVAARGKHRVISILTSCVSSGKRDEFTKELLDYGFEVLSRKHDEIKIITNQKELEDKETENAGLNKLIENYN
jgi:D-alanyl-D-alanine carboxypeptidase